MDLDERNVGVFLLTKGHGLKTNWRIYIYSKSHFNLTNQLSDMDQNGKMLVSNYLKDITQKWIWMTFSEPHFHIDIYILPRFNKSNKPVTRYESGQRKMAIIN